MVRTRRQGARSEGVSYSETPKRRRNPTATSRRRAALARRDASASMPGGAPEYKDAWTQTHLHVDISTQMDVELTSYPEPASAKRRREEDETAPIASSKRQRKAETPKFLFSATRNRSLLTSAPAKTTTQHESPFFDRPLEPTGRQSTPTRPSRPRERAIEPETPTAAPAPQGGLFGSVKKIFGFFTGTMEAPPPAEQKRGSPSEETASDTEREAVEIHSPATPTPEPNEPASPTPNSEVLDSHIYNRDYFKRRRFANTVAGRGRMESKQNDSEAGETDFNPVETSGTNKRKLASLDGEIPGPARGGFGIDDSYLEVDAEVNGVEDSESDEAPPSTPINKAVSQTPLRSAMRQNGGLFGTLRRSAKSVRINPNTSVKHVYGQYGYSGEYHGSMFSAPSDATESTIHEVRNMHSPITLRNTKDNESPKFRLNQDIVDPNDEFWRPSLANPAPGHFRVPDLDEDDDEEEGDDETTLFGRAREQDQVPPQPSTPRMSHAELPSQASPSTGHTDSMSINDSAETRLNKARSEAQRYKPARSSRLSLSEHARSRSSSPPESEDDFTESHHELSTPSSGRFHGDNQTEAPNNKTLAQSAKAHGREELNNSAVGEDGMTDYQREHQYDDWAANLAWPEPQSYEEAGIASDYIADLVRKNWTQRDTRESIDYWDREFEEGLRAARDAAAHGKELVWITDPQEMFG